jgi:hypothetical protein
VKHNPKKLPLRLKALIISLITIVVIATVLMTIGALYFGFIGLFNLLGIHYDDFNTLFMFTIFYCAFSLIGEVVLKGFIYVVHYFKVKKWQIKWIFLFLTAFFINIAIISSLDDQLTGIFIHPETKFIVSLFLAALDLAMEWDKI